MYFGDMGSNIHTMFWTGLFGLLAAAPVYAVIWLFTRRRFPAGAGIHVLRYLFLTYLICVGMMTLVPSGFDAAGGANLVPFSSIADALLSTSEVALQLLFLNILMFVPMGVFLPWVFPKLDRLYKAVLIFLGATLLIELLQAVLPGGRAFDIDDILLNAFGGAIGYSLFALVSMLAGKKEALLREKIACAAVLALLPAVALGFTAAENGREFKYGFSYTLMVPEEAQFTGQEEVPRTAMTYVCAVSQEGIMAGLAEKLSIAGQPREDGGHLILEAEGGESLTVFPDGGWMLHLRDPDGFPPDEPDEALAADAAKFLQEHGFWQEAFGPADINDTFGVDFDGTERVNGKQAVFRAPENDPAVWGGIDILFDDDGIYEVYSGLYQYAPYREAELMPPGEALAEIMKTHRCYVAVEFGTVTSHPQKAVLDRAELVYDWGMSAAGQNLPVWKLSGTFYDHGRQAQGYIMAPAIRG